MRKWLAGKLFNLAMWLDWDAVLKGAKIVVLMDDSWNAMFRPVSVKKKVGRPLGSKDKKPRNRANMGRPLGSKNKSPSRNNKSPSRKVQS